MTRLRHAAVSTFVSSTTELDGTDWNDYHVDEDGNAVQVLTEVAGLSTTSSAAAATANVTALQAALLATGIVRIVTPGTYYINNTLLVPDNTEFYLGAGVTLKLSDETNRLMFRCANVRMVSDGLITAMAGFQLLYADTASTAGTGTLTWTLSGTTLTWQAPGDTAGTPVNVAAAGYFRIPSGTAGKALYLIVGTALVRPSSNKSCSIYVATNRGAVIGTAAVTSNVATVVEAAHGRLVGDIVEIYRPSAGTNVVTEIASIVSTTSYTVAWTVTNFTSEAIAVNGTSGIVFSGQGTLDGNGINQSGGSGGYTCERFAVWLRNGSRCSINGVTGLNSSRFWAFSNIVDSCFTDTRTGGVAVFMQVEGYSNRLDFENINSWGDPTLGDDLLAFTSTSTATNHVYTYTSSGFIGPHRNISIRGVHCSGGHMCAVKYTGYTGCTFDGISISGISGTGKFSALMFIDDTANLTGGTIGVVNVSDVSWAATTATYADVLNNTVTGGSSAINLRGLTWKSATQRCIDINAAPMDMLTVDGLKSSGTMTAAGIRFNAANIKEVNLSNVDVTLGAAGYLFTTEGNTFAVDQLNINNLRWNSTTSTSYLGYINSGSAGEITEINISNYRGVGSTQTGFGVLVNQGILRRCSFSNGAAKALSNVFSCQAGTGAIAPIVKFSNATFDATARYIDFRVGGTAMLNNVYSTGLTSLPFNLGGTSQTYAIHASNWNHGLTEVFTYGTTPVVTCYGWDIKTNPITNLQLTVGQYITSNQAANEGGLAVCGNVNGTPAWYALAGGAAGVNAAIT